LTWPATSRRAGMRCRPRTFVAVLVKTISTP
jgi:hypothetical protein